MANGMTTFISFSLVTLAVILAVPVAVFFVEVVAAVALPQRDCLVRSREDSRSRVAILVPAHNESTGMLPTLAGIKAQMRAGDRLLVVADNCTDDTAAVAAAAGAEVVERNDPDRRGKGYALDRGLRQLAMDPPDIVTIIDSDCRLEDRAIDRLAAACAVTHRPVQALDRMTAPNESPINFRVAEFAWRVRNWVRPLGLRALGLPCQLMGTGMAFPWDLIRSAELANALIMEDRKLGLDLTLAGNPPIFCPFPCVTSDFPLTVDGVQSQRLRWEGGSIGAILTIVPRLIFLAIARADIDLLALALDAAVPPLALLGVLIMVMSTVSGLATLLGISSAAILVSSVSLLGLIGGVFLCWLKYGRDILPRGSILLILSYVFGKLPLYRRILSRKFGAQWIRTDRRKV
jgi:cellulose synthase/poly-beta-1,6-N-acetylglucosamine synthase-like glycosyltransferase